MHDKDQALSVALDWARRGRRVALATVVSTQGSAPRPIGARLVVDEDGRFEGSVSSGCVEAEIIAAAADVIAAGRPALREFGPGDDGVFAVTLTCGGRIRIFIEPVQETAPLQTRLDRAQKGEASATLLDLSTGARDDAALLAWDGSDGLALAEALRNGGECLIETRQGPRFLEFWRPPLRLVIVGATHIAQILAPLAHFAGYEVTVVDPRPAFADAARFPGLSVVTEPPSDFFAARPPDARTAVVALSHEARFDDSAMVAALESDAFYVGALGSRASAKRRLERLRGRGVEEPALARLCAPIGLAIGAQSPAEIAIAIAAELTRALRQPALVALRAAAE